VEDSAAEAVGRRAEVEKRAREEGREAHNGRARGAMNDMLESEVKWWSEYGLSW